MVGDFERVPLTPVIPGRPGASAMRHPTGARTRAPKGAANPESIFQRLVFMLGWTAPDGIDCARL
jgi:hypothetical protein